VTSGDLIKLRPTATTRIIKSILGRAETKRSDINHSLVYDPALVILILNLSFSKLGFVETKATN